MRSLGRFLVAAGAAVVLHPGRAALPGSGATDAEVRVALGSAQAAFVAAAGDVLRGDAVQAAARVQSSLDALRALMPGRRDVARTVAALERCVAALGEIGDDATPAAVALRTASTSVARALGRLGPRGGDGCTLVERGRGGGFHRPGYGATFVLRGGPRGATAELEVENDDDSRTAVLRDVVRVGRATFRVRWGPDAGAATLRARWGTETTSRAFCLGAPGVLTLAPPSAPDYGAAPLAARAGAAVPPSTPAVTGGGPLAFDVVPPLPAGLALDPANGTISGTPDAAGPATTHRVTVRNARSESAADVVVDVDPPLPEGVHDLDPGFAIERVAEVPAVPVKIAFAPDGRLFVSELTTGAIRVVEDGALAESPLVTVPVLRVSPEHGLFGLAPAPDFTTTGELYVMASTPADATKPDRTRILRYVVTGATATGPDVVVDDLPLGATQNGGHLAFGPDGALYATIGDVGAAELAQDDASLAGRILRIARDGSVPAGNPIAGSLEWCRGFRNPFAMAFDPVTGRLFATENGPAAHDELDFVQPGKNFEWGAPEDAYFGALTGIRVFDWTPVIVPTGIAGHDGTQLGPSVAGNLFVGSYDRAQVRLLVLEGIDLREERTFVQFDENEFLLKPLDLAVAPDGSLWISTFASIWRVRRD